jgi:hypothetical protein
LLAIVFYVSWRIYSLTTNPLDQTLAIGTIGVTVGLLINASYIDIFESSKIAYTLWMLVAIVIKLYDLQYRRLDHVKKPR